MKYKESFDQKQLKRKYHLHPKCMQHDSTATDEELKEINFNKEGNVQKYVSISSNLTKNEKKGLFELLKEHHSMFAWSY